MQLETTLFSVDTLHVRVPESIDSGSLNERLADYSVGAEYRGLDEEDGGLMVDAKDLVTYAKVFRVYDNALLNEFFDSVSASLGDADQVYFHR